MEYKILHVDTDMRSQFQYLMSPATNTLNQVFKKVPDIFVLFYPNLKFLKRLS
jgi:hypothetical protein